ncbi:EAL domain-containing protein [Neptuniibacter caesariensis]|uniref:cyclic-guanylate-specific phosphodiesterase n=1 Tax=Neptuniibacter caesariensis TaxID=207954 RepID=A0A7U8GTG2_NEPCE|nr:EAL domain-containing protein [Neptuniibacter caesariensis]EAR62396.1 regulatory component of sensory transduction system [Oceanospirillum sp. MED92] [Neptuniibacter caesariensis]
MESSSFIGLINNVALLLAMGIVYDSLGLQNIHQRFLREGITGILVGLLGMAVMLTPWELIPGVFFDARWVLISLCGLYFGVIPTLIAVVMTVTLRLYQGGAGIYVGSAVIICSALIGLGWRAYIEKHNKALTWWRLYFLGLSVQITVLCLMFFMPEHLRYKIIAAIAPTILIFYPIGTMLLGMILSRQEERRLAERELHISRQILNRERGLLRGLIDALPDHIFIKDKEGKYLGCNKAFQSFTGHQEADLIGKTDQDFSESNHAITDKSDTLQVINNLLPINREAWTHEQDGSPILLESQLAPFLDMDGEPQGIVGISRDITEKRKAEERILTLSQAVEQSPVSVVITNLKGEVEYVNSTFESVTGYSQAEVLGKDSSILKSGKTPPGRYADMWAKLVQGESWQGEFQNKKKNGEIFWEQAHIAPVLDAEGEVRHFLAVKQDVTKQKAQEEKILHQAHFDGLTELPNRFLAMHRLETMMHEAKRNQHQIAVLFLDMDDFKKVNDTLGHDMGDKILVEAAKRLQGSVRDSDTIGRLGGDEFIVLINHLERPEQALPIAQNLLQQFRSSLTIDGRDILLTMSIGIALYPGDGTTPSELLRNADSAMYHSKAAGRNSFHFYTQEMNIEANRRLQLEEQLHNALDRNELRLLYQPVVDLKTRKIVGAEALLRWDSKELGAISPEEFIPVAEHTGLIVEIGKFVLDDALRTTSRWIKTFIPDFHIAINLSPRQFRDPHLIDNIESFVNSYGLEGRNLELEITEGVLMSQHADVEEAIAKLTQKGISISMDDFGTGYSSLSYLRSYPFNILKVDRSFINDISVDAADLELVNASIDMAHGLGLKVIAEGVETEEQTALLLRKNCDMAQGYYFSKPIPADELEEILKKQTSH